MGRMEQITRLKLKKSFRLGASRLLFSKAKPSSQGLANTKSQYVIIDGQRFRFVSRRHTSQQQIAFSSK